jgi:hypothetical protein
MSGGNYSVTGGFWNFNNVVRTHKAPTLFVSLSNNVVPEYRQNVAGLDLMQNGNLATPVASWSASSSPTLIGGTNYLSVTNPAGNVFFRLKNP